MHRLCHVCVIIKHLSCLVTVGRNKSQFMQNLATFSVSHWSSLAQKSNFVKQKCRNKITQNGYNTRFLLTLDSLFLFCSLVFTIYLVIENDPFVVKLTDILVFLTPNASNLMLAQFYTFYFYETNSAPSQALLTTVHTVWVGSKQTAPCFK